MSRRLLRFTKNLLSFSVSFSLPSPPRKILNWKKKLMALKQNQGINKQKLAQYTWTETETIAIKGEVKDTKIYQVQMVKGQQQKTEVSNEKAQRGGREGRIKECIIEKKTEEYEQYGQQFATLAKQYTAPDPERLMQAKQAGNVSLQLGNSTVALVIKNYVKQGDSITSQSTRNLSGCRTCAYSHMLTIPRMPLPSRPSSRSCPTAPTMSPAR